MIFSRLALLHRPHSRATCHARANVAQKSLMSASQLGKVEASSAVMIASACACSAGSGRLSTRAEVPVKRKFQGTIAETCHPNRCAGLWTFRSPRWNTGASTWRIHHRCVGLARWELGSPQARVGVHCHARGLFVCGLCHRARPARTRDLSPKALCAQGR